MQYPAWQVFPFSFGEKKKPRNGIFGFALLLAPFFARSLTLVPRSLLLKTAQKRLLRRLNVQRQIQTDGDCSF